MHRKFEKHCFGQTRILTNILSAFLFLAFPCRINSTFTLSLPVHTRDLLVVILNVVSSMEPFAVTPWTRQINLQNACQAPAEETALFIPHDLVLLAIENWSMVG